jgi:hypothetical protein
VKNLGNKREKIVHSDRLKRLSIDHSVPEKLRETSDEPSRAEQREVHNDCVEPSIADACQNAPEESEREEEETASDDEAFPDELDVNGEVYTRVGRKSKPPEYLGVQ